MARQSHIEAVARALCIEDGCNPDGLYGNDFTWKVFVLKAVAAIAALERLGAYVGEGWEAVPSEPTEPTEAMIEAGAQVLFDLPGFFDPPSAARKIVKDILLAAKPKPAQGKE